MAKLMRDMLLLAALFVAGWMTAEIIRDETYLYITHGEP